MTKPVHALVTGGAGMIGSNLVHRLAAMGQRVTVVDNLWRGRLENLFDGRGRPVIDLRTDFHRLDLMAPGALDGLLRKGDVDVVYHLADIVAGIGYVFSNQREIFRTNTFINSNVADSVARHPVGRYVYVSTACGFPKHLQTSIDARPLVEEDQYPANPESAYGWSKLMGEYEVDLLGQEQGIPTATLILHNVYGAPCDFGTRRAQVIPSLVRRVIESDGGPLVVWGSGAQGRAFVHVDDVTDALVAAPDHACGQGPVQIGPGVCTPIRALAETIVAISGKPIDIQFDTSKPEGDRGRCADYSKARRLLGWEPRVEIGDGLERLYAWMSDRLRAEAAAPARSPLRAAGVA